MPAFLVVHIDRHGDDTLLEDPHLTVELLPDWAVFHDQAGPCYAVPREQIRSIMRVDDQGEPGSQVLAPYKE